MLELQRGSGIRQPVAWLQRQVIFDHNTLESAAFELNRYNDLQIRILDPQLAAILVSGNFSAYDAEAFVKFLERQSGIRVTRNGKYILVSASPIS